MNAYDVNPQMRRDAEDAWIRQRLKTFLDTSKRLGVPLTPEERYELEMALRKEYNGLMF